MTQMYTVIENVHYYTFIHHLTPQAIDQEK